MSISSLYPSLLALTLVATPGTAPSQPSICNVPSAQPVAHVELPANPFTPLPTRDGCWLFVTMTSPAPRTPGSIAVLRRANGIAKVEHIIAVNGSPTGAVLTHDETLLIAAVGPRVAIVDVERMQRGRRDAVLGYVGGDVERPGRIYVNVTGDDRHVFVSDEAAQTITVIDLARARRGGFGTAAIVGRIPVGRAPVALTFSADERYLYTTSQQAPAHLNWPIVCRPQGSDPAQVPPPAPDHINGAIVVVDVARAKTDPANAVAGVVRAGCNPVRLALSPRGDLAYVTARTDNALLVFDTARLLTTPDSALVARVPVGTAPVGVAVIDSGRKVVVTNSNRFAGDANDKQDLTVIDATHVRSGAGAVLGTITAGAFPRELRVTADGKTLLVSNFASRTLQLIDIARVPIKPTTTRR
jgi:6-phosphogluconolactonase (cycloisomerase 2 family)